MEIKATVILEKFEMRLLLLILLSVLATFTIGMSCYLATLPGKGDVAFIFFVGGVLLFGGVKDMMEMK